MFVYAAALAVMFACQTGLTGVIQAPPRRPRAPRRAASRGAVIGALLLLCPVPLTVRGTQALVSFAPLAFKLFFAARHNAVLRRSPFPSP